MTSIWRIGGGRGVEIGGSRVVHGVAAVAEQVSPRGSSVMQGSCSKVPVSSSGPCLSGASTSAGPGFPFEVRGLLGASGFQFLAGVGAAI